MLEKNPGVVIFPNPFRFAGAVFRLLTAWVKKKEILTTQEVDDERQATCRACEFFEADSQQCRVCTCFIQIKASLAEEKCPKKKWRR